MVRCSTLCSDSLEMLLLELSEYLLLLYHLHSVSAGNLPSLRLASSSDILQMHSKCDNTVVIERNDFSHWINRGKEKSRCHVTGNLPIPEWRAAMAKLVFSRWKLMAEEQSGDLCCGPVQKSSDEVPNMECLYKASWF